MAHQTSSEDHIKDPQAKLDYSIDWFEWLDEIGDEIATSTWTVSSGITISASPAPTNTTTNATVWLEGGTDGVYNATNTITTVGGRVDERTITIRVQNR